jgi:hypothetical protein
MKWVLIGLVAALVALVIYCEVRINTLEQMLIDITQSAEACRLHVIDVCREPARCADRY